MSQSRNDQASRPAHAGAVRMFGPLQLLRLLGKSERSMAWQVADPRTQQELMLVLPRAQPASPAALEAWQDAARRAARLSHPQIAPVVMSGVQDGWPFVAHDLGEAATLAERLPASGMGGAEAAALAAQVLQGLAFAHEAGVAHLDLQPFLVLVTDTGQLRLAGMAVALETVTGTDASVAQAPTSASGLREQRSAAERDVLAAGLLLHQMLAGVAALPDADLGRSINRLPPWCGHSGREFIRLPWSTAHPVADPLRAIVNRATERQERQRYRNARTLLRALEGWLRTEADSATGPLALLLDRIQAVGVLPSQPGAASTAARLALMERERTSELAEVVLQDFALAFELLRQVNSAQVRGAMAMGSGPVLTVRRAIAMLGLDGVRRAALALRPWPGPLGEAGAAELQRQMQRVRRAGRLAVLLRPAGYDPEVVYLVTLLQDLGRLVVNYHFPDDAAQVRRLMQPAPPAKAGDAEEPGMTEQAAAFAVLGADIEAIGAAVARHWGLDESVLSMVRRLPLAAPTRTPEDDDGWLRAVASCAHEAMEALQQPAAKVGPALLRVVQRHGRALDFDARALQQAVQASADASTTLGVGAAAPVMEAPPPAAAASAPEPVAGAQPAGSLRAAASRASGAQA
jgi:non-specific serine/threonine protein kinase